MPRRAAALLPSLLAVASAGGGDPLAPGDVAGMHPLRVDGDALPFAVATEPGVERVHGSLAREPR